MTVALYATIWLSLACLLVGEVVRRHDRRTPAPAGWGAACSAAGVVLAAIHTLIAVGVTYDWDHSRAVEATAQRAAAVYGAAWPGSLYVNYAFLAWWLADTCWWWRAPRKFVLRPAPIEWLWRVAAFTMVVNGAVVFASPAGRLAGVPLAAGLLLVWWNDRRLGRRAA